MNDTTEFYRFVRENVSQSNNVASHFGTIGSSRYYVVYETILQMEIFAVNDEYTFVLEHTIPLIDFDIDQLVYSDSTGDYFALLVTNRLSSSRSIHIYTNYLKTCSLDEDRDKIHFRLDGELINRFKRKAEDDCLMSSVQNKLNIIEFQHADISQDAVSIDCCPINGNFLVTLKCQVLIFKYCLVSVSSHATAPACVDFVLFVNIDLCRSVPIVKIAYNYLALMSCDHFTLIQLDLEHDAARQKGEQANKQASCDIIFNRLFDQRLDPRLQHAECVWGPVQRDLCCQFSSFDHITCRAMPCNVIFCQYLQSIYPAKCHPTDKSQNYLHKQSKLNVMSYKDGLFAVQLCPFKHSNDSVYAVSVYVLWDNTVNCFVVDLRRDALCLVPISKLNISLNGDHYRPSHKACIKEFSASVRDDLLHVYLDCSLETYITHVHSYLLGDSMQQVANCKRPFQPMMRISSNKFFNVISMFTNVNLLFMVCNSDERKYTIYCLTRASISQMLEDLSEQIEMTAATNSATRYLPACEYLLNMTKLMSRYAATEEEKEELDVFNLNASALVEKIIDG